jgi:MFS family permease
VILGTSNWILYQPYIKVAPSLLVQLSEISMMATESEKDKKIRELQVGHAHLKIPHMDEENGDKLEDVAVGSDEPFPDGGVQAWRTALGGFLAFIASIGYLSGGSVFQSYFKTIVLPDSSTSDIAWIGSVQIWGCYFIGIGSGTLSDKYGPALPLALGTFFMVFGNMMSSLSTTYYQFLLSQGFCVALGMGLIFTPALAIQSQWFLKRRGFVVGFVMSGQMVGGMCPFLITELSRSCDLFLIPTPGVIWPVLVNRLLNFEGVSFSWTLRIIGFMQLGIMLAATLLVQRRFRPQAEPASLPLRQYLTNGRTMLLTFAILLMNLGLYVPWVSSTSQRIQNIY